MGWCGTEEARMSLQQYNKSILLKKGRGQLKRILAGESLSLEESTLRLDIAMHLFGLDSNARNHFIENPNHLHELFDSLFGNGILKVYRN